MTDFESIRGPVPGARTASLLDPLRLHESRNVTYVGDDFPVFWESARGATVTDVDGNRYLDLTSAFGVANVGHANPRVVAAIHQQAASLMHGMGDVHPSEPRTRLFQRLASIVPSGLDKMFLATTGSEAIEAAIKTAVLATGRFGFVAYTGAYHGLSLGALALSGIPKFRAPFAPLIEDRTVLLDYPRAGVDTVEDALRDFRARTDDRDDIAAVVIEPIQGRGGCIVPPEGYLRGLRAQCDERGILLVFDEIYTGFGRTGNWFACMHDDVVPDIMCIGKAMGSGFPISAAIARAHVMDAWPRSAGEALHTSTYLGNPMGCAAAIATIDEIERLHLIERAGEFGTALGSRLGELRRHPDVVDVRGRGFMWGVQVTDAPNADRIVKRALRSGVIVLQAGIGGDVLSITPPLVMSDEQLYRAIDILEEVL
ncbi:MAG: aspartate aminotransferase family protein [Candidatus Eremiobacteraeota bacterium]|nr:aspartate aminotransferase family protein [Candidatus Eremiobacteraeota bacterium]